MNAFAEQIREAFATSTPLCIRAGNSKAFYAGSCNGAPLDIRRHQGIVDYQPEELVITVRAGTPLREVRLVLAEQGQMLAFEPPEFSPESTFGGMIASGFSGPARPWRGSLRDAMLGVRIINGKGDVLQFGGRVIKNVAGYDVARLMAGAFGSLGLILQASIRTMPLPETEFTQTFAMDRQQALERMRRLGRSTLPVSGAAWYRGELLLRFSGSDGAVREALTKSASRTLAHSTFWTDLNRQRLDFFTSDRDLWRLSLPPAAEDMPLPGEQLLDWGGAQRWLLSDAPARKIRSAAAAAGGHATLFRSHDGRQQPLELPAPLLPLHQRLKTAFDPGHILNPGRLYPDL